MENMTRLRNVENQLIEIGAKIERADPRTPISTASGCAILAVIDTLRLAVEQIATEQEATNRRIDAIGLSLRTLRDVTNS